MLPGVAAGISGFVPKAKIDDCVDVGADVSLLAENENALAWPNTGAD